MAKSALAQEIETRVATQGYENYPQLPNNRYTRRNILAPLQERVIADFPHLQPAFINGQVSFIIANDTGAVLRVKQASNLADFIFNDQPRRVVVVVVEEATYTIMANANRADDEGQSQIMMFGNSTASL